MARELWAKLHVELLDEEKLCARPDSDFKLWVCMILLAKQTTEDGVIHKVGPSSLRERFSLKCSAQKVLEALEHFQASGMVKLNGSSIQILNYEKRQAVKDFREKNADRQHKWRERHVTSNSESNSDVTLPSNGQSRLEEKRSDHPLSPPQGGPPISHPFRPRKAKAEPAPPARWVGAGFSSEAEYMAEIQRVAKERGGSEEAYADAVQTVRAGK